MNAGLARCERLFPLWYGGPEVSELGFRIFRFAFPRGVAAAQVERGEACVAVSDHVSTYDVVHVLAQRFEVDEADVLRALAELERCGVFHTRGGR